jgi:hypothetical protein
MVVIDKNCFSGASLRFLEVLGGSWRFLEVPGGSWRFLEVPGGFF